jgi:hydroxymethylglutaryl-CoA lyase
MNEAGIQLVECPRDAMQGWKTFIPTDQKVSYLNALLRVGFHTIDFGSFVSAKAIPQMADTKEVIGRLEMKNTSSKLLAIIANVRGAEEAALFDEITYLGFPFSVSETFQLRNTNSTIAVSFDRVKEIQDICIKHNKELVIYLSMGFGNPYGDPYSEEIVFRWAGRMAEMGIRIISLADTVGLATAQQVESVTRFLVDSMPDTTIGVHLHSSPNNWKEKFEAAVKAGCKRFDGALRGIGGCPMANDELVGNMDTELMVSWLDKAGFQHGLNKEALKACSQMAAEIFV